MLASSCPRSMSRPGRPARASTMGSGRFNGALTRDGARRTRSAPRGILRVVVADDHPFYRQGLARLLSQSGVEVVGQASNGPAAIELVEQTAPDVAGASGYVLKDGPVEDVVAGIRAAAAGESLLSPRIAGTLLDRINDRERAQ